MNIEKKIIDAANEQIGKDFKGFEFTPNLQIDNLADAVTCLIKDKIFEVPNKQISDFMTARFFGGNDTLPIPANFEENNNDLFENYDKQPQELKIICDKWLEILENEGLSYEQVALFLKEVQAVGYTFEYDLSSEPFNLRLMTEKEKEIVQIFTK